MGTTKREQEDRNRMINNLIDQGFSRDEASQLRRISMTLRHWYELECGTDYNEWHSVSVARGFMRSGEFVSCEDAKECKENGNTCKPYMRISRKNWKVGSTEKENIRYFSTPDKERGATKRLDAIMARHKNCTYYLQTDPRGAALYIVPKSQIKRYAKLWGHPVDISSNYSTVGICVY